MHPLPFILSYESLTNLHFTTLNKRSCVNFSLSNTPSTEGISKKETPKENLQLN